VSVAIEDDGKYLMVREAKKDIENLWNFPSGKAKEGETLIEAAKREALEETGFEIEITGLCSVYHYPWDNNEGISIRFNFWGKKINNNQQELAKDVLEVRALTKDNLREIIKNKEYRFGGVPLMISDVLHNKRVDMGSILTTNQSIEKSWENADKNF
jgi:ADP-ribose pyrophosphatase YjhB (NUDIX family)